MTTDLDDDASTIRRGAREDLVSSDGELESSLRREPRHDRNVDWGRWSRNRSTVLGFALLGALSFVAGVAIPAGRQVLFALAGVGAFAAVLTYAVAPGRLIEARDGARAYETAAANAARLVEELGGTGDRRYVPDGADGRISTVRLSVPVADDAPSEAVATGPESDSSRRELVLEPTGVSFVRELDRSLESGLATRPDRLAEQLTGALTDRFELVGRAEPTADAAAGRVDVVVSDSAFGPLDRFDHPAVSTLAVGLATGLERPIDVAVAAEPDGEWLVTCRWERSESGTDTDG
jgi:hypothetical protein